MVIRIGHGRCQAEEEKKSRRRLRRLWKVWQILKEMPAWGILRNVINRHWRFLALGWVKTTTFSFFLFLLSLLFLDFSKKIILLYIQYHKMTHHSTAQTWNLNLHSSFVLLIRQKFPTYLLLSLPLYDISLCIYIQFTERRTLNNFLLNFENVA